MTCYNNLYRRSASRLGLTDTFLEMVVLFYLTGMGFGCSYSLLDVDSIEFVKTSNSRKAVRTILGVVLSTGMYYGIVTLYDNIRGD